ncbi:MAG: hypothetical protein KF757_04575 [Phycisphaeraceae bacterium]|nr:hypothetical protein [Phycisphaeraceae bacterium]MCW5764275.1 hypothetical protein [Phycisphaeraceae bacterium]
MAPLIRSALSKPGNILSLTIGSLTLSLLVILSALAIPRGMASSEPSTSDLGVLLHRLGLEPENLAAAGVQPNQVATLMQEAGEALAEVHDELLLAQVEFAAARRQIAALERALRSGTAPEGAASALSQARTSAAALESQIAAAHAGIFSAATSHLSSPVVNSIQRITSARRWGLPVQYSAAERSESAWVALRDALSQVRACAQRELEPDSACTNLIASENSRTEVAQAAAFLNAHLDGVKAAFHTALAP